MSSIQHRKGGQSKAGKASSVSSSSSEPRSDNKNKASSSVSLTVKLTIGTILLCFLMIFVYGVVLMARNPLDIPEDQPAKTEKTATSQPAPSSSSATAASSKASSKHKSASPTSSSLQEEFNFEELSNHKVNMTLGTDWFHVDKEGIAVFDGQHDHPSTWVQRLMSRCKDRKPTPLRGQKLIETWPLHSLDLYKLAEGKNVSLPDCRLQPQPVYVLGSDRDPGGMLGSHHDHPLMYVNTTLLEFIKSTFQPKLWLYWTGELSFIEEQIGQKGTLATEKPPSETGREVKKEKEGWKHFRILEDRIQRPVNSTEDEDEEDTMDIWRPMLWLSHPGVVAQTHYDTQHNIFIQLQGIKRFHFFSPDTELYSYPNIHRAYRQSQVHFELPRPISTFARVSNDSSSHANRTVAYEVIVYPGDIIYIPPYWQHRVESLTLSLSLSILSPSEVEASLADIFWQKVPFGTFRSSRSAKIAAIRHYFELIFEKLPSSIWNATMHDFMQDLFETRFEPLYGREQLSVNDMDEFCFKNKEDTNITSLITKQHTLFEQCAKNVATSLKEIKYFNGVKLTFLKDYFEQLIRWAVGPDNTAKFIYFCL